MNKQKILQIIVGVISVCGVIAGLAPEINVLPMSWQKYGLSAVGVAIMLDKILVATNQILVGPTKLQSAATQATLAALPDKSVPIELPSEIPDLQTPAIDPTKPAATAPRLS